MGPPGRPLRCHDARHRRTARPAGKGPDRYPFRYPVPVPVFGVQYGHAMTGNTAQHDKVQLSRRELEIARLVAEGLTNKEIAARLFISERTVDGHLEHVREKLEVNTRAQVAAWVVRQDSPVEAPAPSTGPRRRWWPWRWAPSRRQVGLAAVLLVALEATIVLA